MLVGALSGVLEGLFEIDYLFHDIWGVSRVSLEVFTLGTVALLLLVGAACVTVARRQGHAPAAAGPADS
ncbi:hypothetical protein ACIRPT_27840 [Streptomyces sp. NPDC101227]|uniref:hypothetical protein n=1 Tax=Streptomyces sp. NPDC101227 TaxID=3366136 RepID=UPI003801BA24